MRIIAEGRISFRKAFRIEEYLINKTFRFRVKNEYLMNVLLNKDTLGNVHEIDVKLSDLIDDRQNSLPDYHDILFGTIYKIAIAVRVIEPLCIFRINEHQFDWGPIEKADFKAVNSKGELVDYGFGNKIGPGIHTKKLTIRQLITAFRYHQFSITTPYLLLYNSIKYYEHQDNRSSILTCATLVEVVYKEILKSYFNDNNVPNELCDHVLSITFGLNAYKKLFNKIGLEFFEYNNLKTNIFDIRNRIIHANYNASYDDARNAFTTAEKLLLHYNIKKFNVNVKSDFKLFNSSFDL